MQSETAISLVQVWSMNHFGEVSGKPQITLAHRDVKGEVVHQEVFDLKAEG